MVPFGTVPYFKCKREKVPNGSRSSRNRGGWCTKSQKSSFLSYLAFEVIKQPKELGSLIKYPFSFGTVPFGSARLHWNRTERFQMEPNGTVPNGTVPSEDPKEYG